MVADNAGQRIPLKMLHAEFIQDAQILAKEQASHQALPTSKADGKTIMATYLEIKRKIKDMVEIKMERLMDDPELLGLVISK